jgi:hypothetical protein
MVQLAEIGTKCPDCGDALIKDFNRLLCLSCGRYHPLHGEIKKKPTEPQKIRRSKLSRVGRKGGTAFHHRWTGAERDIVREDYKQTNASAQAIADRLWRERGLKVTLIAVKGQVQLLGLAKKTGRKSWDEMQDDQLRELIGKFAPITIARKMRRSINSVIVRSQRLGLRRRQHDSWYTKSQVGEIFGVGHKRVQCFIDSGALRASYHFRRKPIKGGINIWHIEEEAIVDFLKRHPEELNGRNVDLIQIIRILTRKENASL